MTLKVKDYSGDIATFKKVIAFDFDGETGKLSVIYEDEPLTTFVSIHIQSVSVKRGC